MGSYTILYVDDDHDDLLMISTAFEQYTDNLKLIHANHGVEALQLLESMEEKDSFPCLIILDINMPVMDGKEVLKIIKSEELYREIPVVLFSTSSSPKDKKFAEDLGADFISKPMHYVDLEHLVKQFVEKCRFKAKSEA